MEHLDSEALRRIQELTILLKQADVKRFRFGNVELEFHPPPPPEPSVVRLPPAQTGVHGGPDQTDAPKLPPGYAALFPDGVNGLRRSRGE